MNRVFTLILILTFLPIRAYASECVVLLHDLARSDKSMVKLEKALRKEGYLTVNVSYPSRTLTVEELAEKIIPPALNRCAESEKVNFVTHSMGGIIVRQYLVLIKLTV